MTYRPMWGVRLACGHEGTCNGEPKIGVWLSCWSVVGDRNAPSCQTSRKVIEVWQIALSG